MIEEISNPKMKCPVIYDQEPEVLPERGPLPSTNDRVDFSEYEWMGEELEEFDRKVEEQLWEEEFIEACFEEMLEEEEAQRLFNEYEELIKRLESSNITPVLENSTSPFKLNPNAPEFIPRSKGTDTSS